MSNTVLATTTAAQGTARAGARSLVKLANGSLLLVTFDGAGYVSREGASLTALASASAVTVLAASESTAYNSYDVGYNGLFVGESGVVPNFYTYASGAWTSRALSNIDHYTMMAIATYLSGGTQYYYVTQIGNFNTSWKSCTLPGLTGTAQAGPQEGTLNSNGSWNQGLLTLVWNGQVISVCIDNSNVLQWVSGFITSLPSTNGPDGNTGISLDTLATNSENLAGVVDSNGNAWIAYNDNAGIHLRVLASNGSSWSTKTAVTAQSSDTSPALFQDTAGNVWLFWIDGVDGSIKGQKASASGGSISLSGAVQTVVTGATGRAGLNVIESDASTATLVWTEGTTIYGNTYSLGGGGSTVNGTATLSAQGILSANPGGTVSGAATLSASGTISANGVQTQRANVTLTAQGVLSATAIQTQPDSATLSAAGALVATGTTILPGAATLAANGNVIAQGTAILPASVTTLAAQGIFVATGTAIQPASATLAAVATLTATGTALVSGGAVTLSASGSLSATGSIAGVISATLSASGSLSAQGTTILPASASLGASGTLAATGTSVLAGAAILAAVGALTSTGSVTIHGAATLSASGVITITAVTVLVAGAATMSAAGGVVATGTIEGVVIAVVATTLHVRDGVTTLHVRDGVTTVLTR